MLRISTAFHQKFTFALYNNIQFYKNLLSIISVTANLTLYTTTKNHTTQVSRHITSFFKIQNKAEQEVGIGDTGVKGKETG